MSRRAYNSITESSLDGTTQYLCTHEQFDIVHAAAVSDAQQNEVLGYRHKYDENKPIIWQTGFIGDQP